MVHNFFYDKNEDFLKINFWFSQLANLEIRLNLSKVKHCSRIKIFHFLNDQYFDII